MKIIFAIAGIGLLLSTAPLFIGSAEAAGCKAGGSATARALCSHRLVREADETATSAFDAALALTPDADRQAFTDYQGIWHDNRETDCSYGNDGEKAKSEELDACLITESRARARALAGLPEEGPGGDGKVVPVVKHGNQGFIWSLRSASPTPRPRRKSW